MPNVEKASLTVAGLGIKFFSHITNETTLYIEKSDKVLYLVNEPAMREWICKKNKNSEDLEPLYHVHKLRRKNYASITSYIINILKKECHLCVLIYGHPTIFAQPTLDAAKIAKDMGYPTQILPAISTEDCLFADLYIDPGSSGCQSFDTTDFLLFQRKFDPTSHLILWQPNVIGTPNNEYLHNNSHGLTILKKYLCQFYCENHKIVLYTSAQYPNFSPEIRHITLNTLDNQHLSGITTLYIPPAYDAKIDKNMLKKLKLESI